MRVQNQGEEAITIQLQMLAWSQENGRDVLTPTRDILATPPLFRLEPKQEQTVRVGLRRRPDAQSELTYRLLFEEVLPPAKPEFKGVRIALNISVPVFVAPTAPATPQPRWRLVRTASGMDLTLSNSGNTHLQMSAIRLYPAQGDKALSSLEGNFYVLPGLSRTWPIKTKSPLPLGSYRVLAETAAGGMSFDTTLENP
jgi:fimbrial chaperone protein